MAVFFFSSCNNKHVPFLFDSHTVNCARCILNSLFYHWNIISFCFIYYTSHFSINNVIFKTKQRLIFKQRVSYTSAAIVAGIQGDDSNLQSYINSFKIHSDLRPIFFSLSAPKVFWVHSNQKNFLLKYKHMKESSPLKPYNNVFWKFQIGI